MIRIKSIEKRFTTLTLAVKGARALARAAAMGLFPERELTVTLDAGTFGRLAARLGRGPARDGHVVVLFGPRPDLVGWQVVEGGRPSPDVLDRVRFLST